MIPWLRRHRDELHGRRSGDRYQRAMDSLAKASDDKQDEDKEPVIFSPGDYVHTHNLASDYLPTYTVQKRATQ